MDEADQFVDLGPPTYGGSELPLAPPPVHRKKKEKAADPSRVIGGRRVGAPATTDAPGPPLDLPPHEASQIDSFFTGDDNDEFLDFLEGEIGDDGGDLGLDTFLEGELPG